MSESDWRHVHQLGREPKPRPVVRYASYAALVIFLTLGGAAFVGFESYYRMIFSQSTINRHIAQREVRDDSAWAFRTRLTIGAILGAVGGVVVVVLYARKAEQDEERHEAQEDAEGGDDQG